MTDPIIFSDSFFQRSDLTLESATQIVQDGLRGADYGEFYQEMLSQESLTRSMGKLIRASANSKEGFGFRVGQGERVGYVHSNVFNTAALKGAVNEARQVLNGTSSGVQDASTFGRAGSQLYIPENPMSGMTLGEKIAKLAGMESMIAKLDPRITNISLSYSSVAQLVHIITADGQSMVDLRPRTQLYVDIQLTDSAGKNETGSAMIGGIMTARDVFNETAYMGMARRALQQADILLIAQEAPAGVMDVVLNKGWPAIILHEAVGHGLEGDANRKNISNYSGRIGQQIAAKGVTIVDQGNIPNLRGSLHFDDEGTPTRENVLVEDGVLRQYMQDRQNAMLMQAGLTGNGRRESYAHVPMPRMTNTYFRAGMHDHAEIISSVRDGLYISNLSNGQVDTASGKFNMNATLAWRIRDGKLEEPIKGATIVGDGLSVIQNIKMMGNDLDTDPAAGMCGKKGQKVAVSCGQPTIYVAGCLRVGGSR
jgi:TldD protein